MVSKITRCRLAEDREYSIVDGTSERIAHCTQTIERQLEIAQRAPGIYQMSIPRSGGNRPPKHLNHPSGDICDASELLRCRQRLLDQFGGAARFVDPLLGNIEDTEYKRFRRTCHGCRTERFFWIGRRQIRPQIERSAQQFHPGYAVYQAMMHFPNDRSPVALNPMKKVCLPQRPTAVEHRCEHLHRSLEELIFFGSGRQRMPMNVIANFKLWVVLPRGMRQVERNEQEALAIARQQMHPRLHMSNEFIVIDPAVKIGYATDMQRSVV